MRRILFLGAALLLGIPALALAGGGDSIASAPELPIGQQQFFGGERSDFWRITLAAGDLLIVDFGSTDGDDVNLCVLRPDVSDYTLRGSRCLVEDGTTRKEQAKYVANPAGRFILRIAGDYPCSNNHDANDCRLAYELTGYVKRFTRTVVSAPSIVRNSSIVTLRGRVYGASGGRIQVRESGSSASSLVALAKNGAFSARVRLFGSGLHRIRLTYPGDASHRASGATVSIRVG